MDSAERLRRLVAVINASAWIPNNVGERLMAKQVKLAAGQSFAFSSGRDTESDYKWDEWLNGDLLLLEQHVGEKDEKGTVTKIREKRDYAVNTDAMPGKLRSAARRRFRVVEISRKDAMGEKLVDSLIIRSREMTPDEKIAEKKLREEEKAERKAKAKKDAEENNAKLNGAASEQQTPPASEQTPAKPGRQPVRK